MRNLVLLFSVLATTLFAADVKISQLPLASPAIVTATDSFPFVNVTGNQTMRLKLSDVLDVPALTTRLNQLVVANLTAGNAVVTNGSNALASLAYGANNVVSTLVFRDGSGNFAAGTITANVTGTATGNLSYTANQYGVLVSGSGNVVTVLSPDASTSKVLQSGGTSANPNWLAFTNANTASTIVSRDGSGNFAAGTITAALTGTASGNLVYTPNNHGVLFSGSGNTVTVLAPVSQTNVVLTSSGLSSDPSWGIAYASTNAASTLVSRDSSGNFAAGTITAALTGTASGNTTYTANNHGVVLSSATNAMTVLAPDSSTTKVLKSGGTGADPSWLAYDNANTVSTLVFRDSSANFSASSITHTASIESGSNPSTTGFIRMVNNNAGVMWRNAANTGDRGIWIDSANNMRLSSGTNFIFDASTAGIKAAGQVGLRDGSAAFDVNLVATSSATLSADRVLTLDVVNAARTIKLTGNLSLGADFTLSGSNSITLTSGGSSSVTLPISGTLATLAGSETLTNKVLSGNTAATLISGSGTLTLNTTGTITVPSATDTLVGKATTDTLTNKTLTSPTINGGALSGTFSGDYTISGILTSTNTTDATSSTGAINTTGGVQMAKKLYVGTQSTLTGPVGISNAPDLNTAVVYMGANGAANNLTGTTQGAFYTDTKFDASVATVATNDYTAQIRTNTVAGAIPTGRAYHALAASLGTGTYTRLINYGGVAQTAATNNAFLTDNITFTGNYFIHQTGTTASVLGGALTVGGQLIGGGTTTNDSPSAGQIGEVLTAQQSTFQSNTNGNTLNLVSLSLTAGDWDVWGIVAFSGSGSTSTLTLGAIDTANNTLGTTYNGTRAHINQNLASQGSTFTVGPFPLKLSGSTTYFLNTRADFSAGTVTSAGTLYARRRR